MNKKGYRNLLGVICDMIDINDLNNINLILETSFLTDRFIDYNQFDLLKTDFCVDSFCRGDTFNLLVPYSIMYSRNHFDIIDLIIPYLIRYKMEVIEYWKHNPIYEYLTIMGVDVIPYISFSEKHKYDHLYLIFIILILNIIFYKLIGKI